MESTGNGSLQKKTEAMTRRKKDISGDDRTQAAQVHIVEGIPRVQKRVETAPRVVVRRNPAVLRGKQYQIAGTRALIVKA